MGCALDTCRDTDSEVSTPEGEPEETQPPVAASQSRPLSVPPSVPPPSPPLEPPSVSQALASSVYQLPDAVVIQITDEIRAVLNLMPPEFQAPVDYEFTLPPDASTEMDDTFPQCQRGQATRAPSNFTIVDRNVCYRSFPPTTNGRKMWNKRMKRQGYGIYEGPRSIFHGGRVTRGSLSVCRRCSREIERSLPVSS
ncbi:uncharacterized protein [Leptinotarsa decemlineata]|uniref:uncharacterized protein n=1 Tax=Leptinotarsa decemlineata TaxID=7539 RepID=UPI000C253FC7|nr:uncharacterized protein LOC111508766 [Leptinotarsa decemlineata]